MKRPGNPQTPNPIGPIRPLRPIPPPPLESRPPRRLAIAAPRGAAKSTLKTLILPIHSLLYRQERYIVLISATQKQARQRLRNIKSELQRNGLLNSVYATELSRRDGWTSEAININCVQIDAFSAGTEIRGISYRQWRPTLVILDDVEDENSVYSADQREKLRNWFNETIEHIGDSYTAIEIVGTVLHPDSLLANLLRRPDFQSHRFPSVLQFSEHPELWEQWRALYTNLDDQNRDATAYAFYKGNQTAMDQGARVLWPEKENYYQLQVQLTLLGRRAFFKEKQNEPTLIGEVFFDLNRATRFRLQESTLEILPPPGSGVPPSGGMGSGVLVLAGHAGLAWPIPGTANLPIGKNSASPGTAEPAVASRQFGASQLVVPTSVGQPQQLPSISPSPNSVVPLSSGSPRQTPIAPLDVNPTTPTSGAQTNPTCPTTPKSHRSATLNHWTSVTSNIELQTSNSRPQTSNFPLSLPLSSLRIVGFLDSALGKTSSRGIASGDYAAIATVGIDPAGHLYLLDMWLQRVPPSIQANQIFNLHNLWNYSLFGVESNCFQALLTHPIEQERARRKACKLPWQLPIRPVIHTQNKELRIATLEPLVSNGWLRFNTALPERFWQQIESFPNAEHDDALDALEGAVSLVRSLTLGPIRTTGIRRDFHKLDHF